MDRLLEFVGGSLPAHMDVSDMDAVMAAMNTQAAAGAMASDGVAPETLVILVEA